MMSSAHRLVDFETQFGDTIYADVRANHPATAWVRENAANYEWTLELALCLSAEYSRRYHRQHATHALLAGPLAQAPRNAAGGPRTPHPLCMPEEYHSSDPVHSYRLFYAARKARFAVWAHSPIPFWWQEYRERARKLVEDWNNDK